MKESSDSQAKNDKKGQTLLKYLTGCGIESRRKLLAAIMEGKVSVNRQIIRESGYTVSEKDVIYYKGKRVEKQELLYFAFNKPIRVITTLYDSRRRKTVADFFRGLPRVVPVGRLDYMSSGLLIMTNDGALMHKLMHPKYEIEKEYLVKIDKILPNDIIKYLAAGIELDGDKTAPCKIVVKSRIKDGKYSSMSVFMTLHEGKNREIRRMMEKVGAKVLSLKRIRYKNIFLGNLPEGSYRKLTKHEIYELRNDLP